MKHALSILASLAACNQVYDLEQTRLRDAGPPDAAPFCEPALAFSRRVNQVVFQRCSNYVPATDIDRALASCSDGSRPFIAEGRRDGLIVKVEIEPRSTTAAFPVFARLAPEGDRAIVTHIASQSPGVFSMHERDEMRWRFSYDLPVVVDYDDSMGTPSRRPSARVLHARPNSGVVDELVEDSPGAWRRLNTYPAAELDTLTLYSQFNLTADGLHVVFQGYRGDGTIGVYHAWRDNLDARFGPAIAIEGIPRMVTDGFMTNDCGRIYFSGLSSIFYAQRL